MMGVHWCPLYNLFTFLPSLNGELAKRVNRSKTKMEEHIIVRAFGVTMVIDVTVQFKKIHFYRLCKNSYILDRNKT